MARVKMEKILDATETEIRRAVGDVLKKHVPSLAVNESKFTQDLIKAIVNRCNSWERVPDHAVQTDTGQAISA